MMRGRKRKTWGGVFVSWVVAGGFCLLISATAFAAQEKRTGEKPPPKSGPFKSEAPLTIAGDRMEVNQRDRTIVFEGHVTVQQEDLTITGKRMKVFAAPVAKGKPSQQGQGQSEETSMMGKIDRIEMDGGVRIVQREKVATAEKSIYYHGENKIVLLGNPVVSQGADQIQGRMITLYLGDGRSVVEGGESSPVQAILHPKKSKD
jgi:lipopolysaccharide export system protein LptA